VHLSKNGHFLNKMSKKNPEVDGKWNAISLASLHRLPVARDSFAFASRRGLAANRHPMSKIMTAARFSSFSYISSISYIWSLWKMKILYDKCAKLRYVTPGVSYFLLYFACIDARTTRVLAMERAYSASGAWGACTVRRSSCDTLTPTRHTPPEIHVDWHALSNSF